MPGRNGRFLVVSFVGLTLLSGCGGGGGGGVTYPTPPSGPDTALSNRLTAESVASLISGDTGFAAISGKLNRAITADSGNRNAPVFLAVTDFLDFLQTSGLDRSPVPGVPEFRDLYEDAGFMNVGGADLWNLDLEETDHGQGEYKNSMPLADEIEMFVRQRLRAEVLALIASLNRTPTSFEYRITRLDASGEFFDGSTLDDTETVWIDYGDIAMLRSSLHLAIALMDFIYAYDLDNIDLNAFDKEDDPNVDALALIVNTYTGFGELVRASSLTSSRDHVKAAFSAYQAGAQHILAETSAQRSNGLTTPYRGQLRGSSYFDSTADRDEFITDEAAFRTWAQGIVDHFGTDAFYAIPTEPDGTPIAVGERTSLNFHRLWQGVPFRGIYLLTMDHPIDSRMFIALSELPAAGDIMLTMNGVIDRIHGQAPTAGDLMEGFGMRIDSPPTSTKTIDGNLSDWTAGTNAVTIFRAPTVLLPKGYRDAGEFHVAVDATNLYIAGTEDFTGSPWWYMEVMIESPHGQAVFVADVNGGWFDSFGLVTDPIYSFGTRFEMAVPLANFPGDSWVEIEIALNHEDDADRYYDARTFSDIHVRIR